MNVTCLPEEDTTADVYTPLDAPRHITLGVYLITSGIISGIANLLQLLCFFAYPKVLCTPSAIPEIGLILSDLAVAGLHPFTGTAALSNYWVWGPVGCQLYSFFGFLFGNFQCLVVPFVIWDRYIVLTRKPFYMSMRNASNYVKIFLALFLFSFFWSITPIIGWASFTKTPTKVACTIDWTRRDPNYVSYICFMTGSLYFGPLLLGGYYAAKTCSFLSQRPKRRAHWCAKGNHTFVTWGCLLTTYVAFSGYGLLCLWPLFADPALIPTELNMLPPPMGKLAGLINPVFFLFYNPQLMACLKKLFGCRYDINLLKPDEHDQSILDDWHKTPRLTTRDVRGKRVRDDDNNGGGDQKKPSKSADGGGKIKVSTSMMTEPDEEDNEAQQQANVSFLKDDSQDPIVTVQMHQ